MDTIPPEDWTYTVRMYANARDGSWDEALILDADRLSLADAEQSAAGHAARLSARWGHVQFKQTSTRRWRVWEPGPEGVECAVYVVRDSMDEMVAHRDELAAHNEQVSR